MQAVLANRAGPEHDEADDARLLHHFIYSKNMIRFKQNQKKMHHWDKLLKKYDTNTRFTVETWDGDVLLRSTKSAQD